MNIEKLLAAKQAKVAEYENLKKVLETEKRTAFNSDERTKANEIKLAIDELNQNIELEKSFETEKRSAAQHTFADLSSTKPADFTSNDVKDILKKTETDLRSFLANPQLGKTMTITREYETISRTQFTTSNASGLVRLSTADQLAGQVPHRVLESLGAQRVRFAKNNGPVKFPSITNAYGVMVAEGGSQSELNPTVGSATVNPIFTSYPLRFSEQALASMSEANLNSWIARGIDNIENAWEYKAFQILSGITALSTASGSSMYAGVLAIQEAVLGDLTGYAFGSTMYSRGLQKKRGGSTDGISFVIDNLSQINGIPAVRSTILKDVNANNIIGGDFRNVVIASFGDYQLKYVQGPANAMSGDMYIVISQLGDAAVIDTASFARIHNGHQLS